MSWLRQNFSGGAAFLNWSAGALSTAGTQYEMLRAIRASDGPGAETPGAGFGAGLPSGTARLVRSCVTIGRPSYAGFGGAYDWVFPTVWIGPGGLTTAGTIQTQCRLIASPCEGVHQEDTVVRVSGPADSSVYVMCYTGVGHSNVDSFIVTGAPAPSDGSYPSVIVSVGLLWER